MTIVYLRRLALFGLLIILLAVVFSCASSAKPLETEADFTGFITEIDPGDPGRILAESHADKIVDKYWVTIKDETLIFQQDGESYLQTDFKAFENKQWVRIWFDGPVKESFPMQVDASQVVIFSN